MKLPIAYPKLEDLPAEQEFVGTTQAAHYLALAPITLRLWACKDKGLIKPTRFNNRLYWPLPDVKRVASEMKVHTGRGEGDAARVTPAGQDQIVFGAAVANLRRKYPRWSFDKCVEVAREAAGA